MILAAAACQSTPAGLTEEDRAALEQVIDDVAATLLAADYAAWAGHFSEDAVIFPPNAPVRGRAVIQSWGETFPTIEELSFFDVQLWGQGLFE